jgi:hypothetical protein
MDKDINEYEQEIREILFAENIRLFKNHVLYVGNEILDDTISAKDFWEKLQQLCL